MREMKYCNEGKCIELKDSDCSQFNELINQIDCEETKKMVL